VTADLRCARQWQNACSLERHSRSQYEGNRGGRNADTVGHGGGIVLSLVRFDQRGTGGARRGRHSSPPRAAENSATATGRTAKSVAGAEDAAHGTRELRFRCCDLSGTCACRDDYSIGVRAGAASVGVHGLRGSRPTGRGGTAASESDAGDRPRTARGSRVGNRPGAASRRWLSGADGDLPLHQQRGRYRHQLRVNSIRG
jgi:hypothetical protein